MVHIWGMVTVSSSLEAVDIREGLLVAKVKVDPA